MWDLFNIKTLVPCRFDFRVFVGWFGVTPMWDLFCIRTLVPCGSCCILLVSCGICYILLVLCGIYYILLEANQQLSLQMHIPIFCFFGLIYGVTH
jgi:hypothetical protein